MDIYIYIDTLLQQNAELYRYHTWQYIHSPLAFKLSIITALYITRTFRVIASDVKEIKITTHVTNYCLVLFLRFSQR